jgi:hypothetical protein
LTDNTQSGNCIVNWSSTATRLAGAVVSGAALEQLLDSVPFSSEGAQQPAIVAVTVNATLP